MAVLHVSYSDVCKMEWEQLCALHEEAREFYKNDRLVLIEGIAKAVWGGKD
jgi:hypothetical protein